MDKKRDITTIQAAQPIVQQPINGQPTGLSRSRRYKKTALLICLSLIGLVLILFVSFIIWYKIQLSPVGSNLNQHTVVSIPRGTSPGKIGKILQEKAIIRSNIAFDIYTRLNNKQNILQAGTYRLSPAESLEDIVSHLVKGDVDTFSITFYPGSTLKEHRKVLIAAGYSAADVDQALNATYDSPLFADKPASADLEGYIYGETYNFSSDATVSDILERTFKEYYMVLQDNHIIEGIKAQGYNLFEGITLASIIQDEVLPPASSEPSTDQKQVASVFYNRLHLGMSLGSDVTYQYIADKLNVPRDPNLDSPYNTRRFGGLPPGPISSPGLTALKATAAPADTDYLFFLSGDDDITYFARTDAEHQANIANHCAKKCSIL